MSMFAFSMVLHEVFMHSVAHITVCTRLTSFEVFDFLSNLIALILYKHRNTPRNDGLVGDSHLFGTIQLGLH